MTVKKRRGCGFGIALAIVTLLIAGAGLLGLAASPREVTAIDHSSEMSAKPSVTPLTARAYLKVRIFNANADGSRSERST